MTENSGFFTISRKLFKSELFLRKPASWTVIWLYILSRVNFEAFGGLPRGTGFINFAKEIDNLPPNITPNKIKSFTRFAKKSGMIATRLTTRGIVITVLNYDKFQLPNGKTATTPATDEQPMSNRWTTTISNNYNKGINKQIQEVFDYFLLKTKKRYTLDKPRTTLIQKCLATHSIEDIKKAIDNFAKDEWVERHRFMDLPYCLGTVRGINNLDKWLNLEPVKKSERLL